MFSSGDPPTGSTTHATLSPQEPHPETTGTQTGVGTGMAEKKPTSVSVGTEGRKASTLQHREYRAEFGCIFGLQNGYSAVPSVGGKNLLYGNGHQPYRCPTITYIGDSNAVEDEGNSFFVVLSGGGIGFDGLMTSMNAKSGGRRPGAGNWRLPIYPPPEVFAVYPSHSKCRDHAIFPCQIN